ncbi:MAG: DUF1700 domain-containing protein [Blautia sp.]|nr:DUF1700 domain-containing protein [Blautia sp.]
MKQLESLLQNISPAERDEALQYYNEYFNDAGAENEQAVIEALGNPAKVAENIKRDIYGDAGYQKPQNRAVIKYQQPDADGQQAGREQPKKESLPTWALVLIIIGAILASPAILGIAGGLLGTLAGVILSWFVLIFCFGVTAVILFTVLLGLLITGIMCMWADPLVGAALLGSGLVCGALAILFLMLTVAMAGIATPAIFRGLCKLFSGRNKQRAA